MNDIPAEQNEKREKGVQNDSANQGLFLHAPVAALIAQEDGKILSLNRQASQLLLGDPETTETDHVLADFIADQDKSIAASYLSAVFHDRQQHLLDVRVKSLDDRDLSVRLMSSRLPDDELGCQIYLLDTEKQQLDEEALNHRAYYDQLTGLPNRHLFSDRLHWAILDAKRQNERLAVMLVDLDNFSQVNNTLGHDAGDKLLQAVSAQMISCLREVDTLSRLGGDEFTVLLQHIVDSADAATIAGRLMEAIHQPVMIQERPQQINASIGVCLYPDDGDNADVLIHHADIAMYRSKNNGRNQVSFFSESLKAAVNRQFELENNLRLAMQACELEVWYQPLVDAVSCRIVGLEALLRWRSGKEGVLAARQFLPLADDLGIAASLGDWALKEACRQMKDWLDRNVLKGIDDCRMAINIGQAQLEQPDFPASIQASLEATSLPAESLAIEVSEATLQRCDPSVFERLLSLRKMGIALYLDDFSQGLNSLQKINTIPFDGLKIDQEYTPVFLENKRGESLLEALVKLSHNLGLQVIAEGVENQHAYTWFRTHDCDRMQGYFFSRPLPPFEMEMLLGIRQ